MMRQAWLFILFAFSVPAFAQLALAPVFGEHMVLQRDKPLPVWGQAMPGAKVEVHLAGQKRDAQASSVGAWKVVFDALPASFTAQELTVISNGQTHTLRDLLIGDVWLCAGQSNMEFPLRNEATAQEALALADIPHLRLNQWRFATQYVYAAPFSATQCERLTAQRFYENSWAHCKAQSAGEFSAIGWFFGRELQKYLGVPVGMINLAVGGSPTEAWIRREALQSDADLRDMTNGNWLNNKALDSWCRERGHRNLDKPLADNIVPADAMGANHPFKPSFLWESGMAHIIPFSLRGVLWYQGESNSLEAQRVQQHEKLFPLLVRDWRAQWGQAELPFLYCQLSGIATERGYKSQFWPQFRDQQRRFLETIPHCAMAVTSDLGAPFDVHPRNKRDVARRLMLCARAKIYGENIEYSGPLPHALQRVGSTLIVHASHAKGLKTNDGKAPRGFEIADSSGQFYPAKARIEGQKILLSQENVSQPQSARYAWQPFPDANLVNAANLPASTFEITLP